MDMSALINSFYNSSSVSLLFKTVKDAKQFKDFVHTYMWESGAGNGYGAYWIYMDEDIHVVKGYSEKFSLKLNIDYLMKMIRRIVLARNAGETEVVTFRLRYGESLTGISFKVDNLPPRRRPEVNGLCRIIDSSVFPEDLYMASAVVLEDRGDLFVVTDSMQSKSTEMGFAELRTYEVPASAVMKIKDFRIN